jgi:hypothetical protein
VKVRLPGEATLEVSDVRLVPGDWVAALAADVVLIDPGSH